MALARSAVGGGPKQTTAGTSATATVTSNATTPAANALLLDLSALGIDQTNAGTLTGTDSHSGTGAWTSILSTLNPGGWRMSTGVQWAKAGASPGSGTFTVTRPPGNVDQLLVALFEEITGYDPANPIAQSKTGVTASGTFTVTLDNALTPGSMTYVLCASDGDGDAQTLPVGYTSLHNAVVTAGWYSFLAAYHMTPPSTSVQFTGLGTGNNVGLVVEINPDPGGGAVYVPPTIVVPRQAVHRASRW